MDGSGPLGLGVSRDLNGRDTRGFDGVSTEFVKFKPIGWPLVAALIGGYRNIGGMLLTHVGAFVGHEIAIRTAPHA